MSGVPVARGFFGKIPARGDFVRYGLPARFVTAWDEWASAAVTAAQARMEGGFHDAWLQAPAWRFVLSPGICGPDAAIGVWLPGIDRIGRLFPLVFAVLGSDAGALSEAEGEWLAVAEHAGRDALAVDEGPESLLARVSAPLPPGALAAPQVEGAGIWWTEGGPRVARCVLAHDTLPPPDGFAAMLDDAFAAEDAT